MNTIIKAAPSGTSPFDSIRQIEEGTEFWLARQLMPMLGYQKWQRFGTKESDQVSVVCRAIISCSNSGGVIKDNFLHLPKQGTGFSAIAEDWKLSRQACYLVAMNGDVTKPEIAAAQSYFATKTREAEVNAKLSPTIAIDKLIEGLQDLKLLFGNQAQVDQIEQRLDQHECEIGRLFKPDGQFFSIRGWANHRKVKINLEQASNYGRIASRLSKDQGIATDKLPDARYGSAKAYHESILIQII